MKSSAEANTRNQLDKQHDILSPVEPTYTTEYVGLSCDTEPAVGEQRAPVDPMQGFELRRFNRQNHNLTSVQLSRDTTK